MSNFIKTHENIKSEIMLLKNNILSNIESTNIGEVLSEFQKTFNEEMTSIISELNTQIYNNGFLNLQELKDYLDNKKPSQPNK